MNRFMRTLLGSPPPDVQAALRRGVLDNVGRVSTQLASPFSPTPDHLQTIVWADIHGADYSPTTRAMGMGVPALKRGRDTLVRVIASMPLISLTGDVRDTPQPRWMTRTDGELHPWHRMVWTVDDLFWYGWSLWAVQRGAGSDGRPILHAGRVPWHRWGVDGESRILVDDRPVQADQCILIPGPHGGLLSDNPTAIRMAADNLQAAATAARNPVPAVDLHYSGDEEFTEEEIDAKLARWTTARRSQTGGVAWTGKNIEAKALGSHDANLLVEGRQADAVDMARIASVPASVVDAPSGDSLTYTTDETRNQQLLDYGAQLYMDAITARLSMDDVVASGRRTAFDTSQFTQLTPNPTGAPTDD